MAGEAGAKGAVSLASSAGVQLRSGRFVVRAQAQERVPVADTCGLSVLSASKHSNIISKPGNNSGVIFSAAISEGKNSNIQPVEIITRDEERAPETSSDVLFDSNNIFSLLAVLAEAETVATAPVVDSPGQVQAGRASAVHQLAELAAKAGDPTVRPTSKAAAAARFMFILLHPGGGQRVSALFEKDADDCKAVYARCFSEWQQAKAARSQAELGGPRSATSATPPAPPAATPPGSETRGRSLQREAAASRPRRDIRSARVGGRKSGRGRPQQWRGSAAGVSGAGKALPGPRPCAPRPPPVPAVGRSSREWPPRPRPLPSVPSGERPWVTVGRKGKALSVPQRAGSEGPLPPPVRERKCDGLGGGPGLQRLPVPRPAAGAGLVLGGMRDGVQAPRGSQAVLVASCDMETRDGDNISGASNVAANGLTCRCGGGLAGGGTRAEEVLLDSLLRTQVELASKHQLVAAAATAAAAAATAAAEVAAASAAQLAAQRQLVMQMLQNLGGATDAGARQGVCSGALRCLGGG